MDKFINKKQFIGVDISKDTLDLSLLDPKAYGSFMDLQIQNSIAGFEQLENWITKQGFRLKDCAFCMEHTGTHGLLFFGWLAQHKLLFCVVPGLQIRRSMGMIRGKNDKVDARRIADYLYTHKAKLTGFEMPCQVLIKLKQLLAYREHMIRIRTALKNSLVSHKQYQPFSGLTMIITQINQHIEQQHQRIIQIEDELLKLIKSDQQLAKNYQLAISVKGIGPIIAAFMLVSTHNFTSFDSGRKYACYAGIAPFEFSSGSSIKGKTRVSKYANKTIKTLLCNGANAAVQWDKQIKSYYIRKRQQGKPHKLVINAVCCKLVNRVFAVVKRQTPFVEVYQHNF